MLYAGWCFPDWKLVVTKENLSGSRSAASQRQISLLCKSTGLAASRQEALSLTNMPFKLLQLLIWQSCAVPETWPLAAVWGAFWHPPRWCSPSLSSDAPSPCTTHLRLLGIFQPTGPSIFPTFVPAERRLCWGPVTTLASSRLNPTLCLTNFSLEGQCRTGTGISAKLRSLHSQWVSRHWPGNATAGLTQHWPLPCSNQGPPQSLPTSTTVILVSPCTSAGAKGLIVVYLIKV